MLCFHGTVYIMIYDFGEVSLIILYQDIPCENYYTMYDMSTES